MNEEIWTSIIRTDFANDPLHELYHPVVVELPKILEDYTLAKASPLILLRCRRPIIRAYQEIDLAEKIGAQLCRNHHNKTMSRQYARTCFEHWRTQLALITQLIDDLKQFGTPYVASTQSERFAALTPANILMPESELVVGQMILAKPELFLTLWKP